MRFYSHAQPRENHKTVLNGRPSLQSTYSAAAQALVWLQTKVKRGETFHISHFKAGARVNIGPG